MGIGWPANTILIIIDYDDRGDRRADILVMGMLVHGSGKMCVCVCVCVCVQCCV